MSALIGMVLRGKRRYGGYLVHVGIVLMFFGFAGSAYQKERDRQARARPDGEDRRLHHPLRQAGARGGPAEGDGDRRADRAGRRQGDRSACGPAKWFFHNHENEPTTEVAIRRAPAEDLYITLGNYDLAEGTATLKLVVNPVVNWIWFGFMLLAIGDRHRAACRKRCWNA